MCRALEELMKEELDAKKIEGKIEGIKALIETCRELGLNQDVVFEKVAEKFALKADETKEYMEKFWK